MSCGLISGALTFLIISWSTVDDESSLLLVARFIVHVLQELSFTVWPRIITFSPNLTDASLRFVTSLWSSNRWLTATAYESSLGTAPYSWFTFLWLNFWSWNFLDILETYHVYPRLWLRRLAAHRCLNPWESSRVNVPWSCLYRFGERFSDIFWRQQVMVWLRDSPPRHNLVHFPCDFHLQWRGAIILDLFFISLP